MVNNEVSYYKKSERQLSLFLFKGYTDQDIIIGPAQLSQYPVYLI